MLERVSNVVGEKAMVMALTCMTARHAISAVEVYNALIGVDSLMNGPDCVVMMDNAALAAHCGIDYYTLEDLNRVVARVASQLTSGLRFEAKRCLSLQHIVNSLVSYPTPISWCRH